MKLEFRLLGDVMVLADGRPLDLGGTRQRSVLAILLLQRDRAIATELLADRLWPDDQPLTANKTVQVYVSRLRHLLGPDVDRLSSTATGYRLAVTDEELDAARFERGLRHAREALGAGSSHAALVAFKEALSLWSGPAFGDLAGQPFARREAERLEELRLQALEELFELRIAAGSGRETIGELRRLLADRPGRERLWRLLMLALYADGRQGEALAAYQEARRYLADELGLDPSLELRELERAILTQEVPRAEPPAPIQPLPVAGAGQPAVRASKAEAVTALLGRTARRTVTVLRAEIVQASDGTLDPETMEVRNRRALDGIRSAVERHGGTIDQADHTGVTAVFGLIVAREDDALRAVRAALELSEEPNPASDRPGLRVGVATGEVLVTPSDEHRATMTGQPIESAARLSRLAAPREILLASETEQLVRGATSTEAVSLEASTDGIGSSVVRVLAVTEGDAIVRRTTTPFVGRVDELHALLAAFKRVLSDGAPGLVTVIGAPGVGKSRLVAEALARVSDRATTLRSRCLPYGNGITYWPVRDLVLAATGIGPSDPRDEAVGKLRAILVRSDRGEIASSRIASIVGLSDEPAPAEEVPWAVRRFFEVLATRHPLVVLVDDLQWAEPVLVDLLEHVLDLGRGPILLVAIARPELEEVHAAWLARSTLSLIRLDSLNEQDAATLLDHLAPELSPGTLRSRILSAAEGNPLFVEQFVGYVSDAVKHGGGLSDRTAAGLPIPPTIGALLAARLDRLTAVERRTLERAAVVGRTFWAGALAELLAPPERADLPRRLGLLARRDWIRPERSEFGDDEAYRFRHLLIRDAAYASLPKRERAELHERFADWLENRSRGNPSESDLIVGYHLEQAYRYRLELGDEPADIRPLADRARQLIAPAGLAAEERWDPHAAISLLKRAADLAPSEHERIELLIALRAALYLAGERDGSAAVDREVAALLIKDPDEGLEHRRRLSQMHIGGVTIAEAEAAYAYYERVGDEVAMIRALEASIEMHLEDFRLAAADTLIDRATVIALKIGRPDRAARISARSAKQYPDGPIRVPDALDRVRRYLELAGSNGFTRALILLAMGQLEAMSGVRDRWRRHFEEAKAIGHDLGLVDPFAIFAYPMWLAITELEFGDPTRVVTLLEDTCSTLDGLAIHRGGLASAATLTAQLLLAVGRLDEVERYAYWGREIAEPHDLDAQARWRMAIAGLRSGQGRHIEAIALARETLALLAGSEAVWLTGTANMTMASALRAAGGETAALDAAYEARRLALAKGNKAAVRKIDTFLAADR